METDSAFMMHMCTDRSVNRMIYKHLTAFCTRIVRHIKRSRVLLDASAITQALEGLGPYRSNILLVHSSLSKCGYVNGGSGEVVNALQRWVPDQTLVMPTHTYCYPDEDGHTPIFDPASTPSQVGIVTEYFRHLPGAIRSIHPTHSLVSVGPLSKELCEGHEYCNTPCGSGTPYDRLINRDCSVLMFGASMKTYTLFYTTIDAAQLPYLYESQQYTLRVRDQDNKEKSLAMWRQNIKIPNRFASMDTWLEERGLLVRRKLGMSELLFIPSAGEVHSRLLKELRNDPLFLVDESARADVAKNFRL
jgi:aminoglycoside 3-N-acetyltransferase